ncbi:CO/xanthine dehydrogenase FAD-binding subunit [Natranaerovirga pectinivora]|uniref:CO/xanthine dehydrogenase FAD-binding subunit n=1 Tax=Natranaerovirga pectinivora TaxID=682400 RepID=A0A4R3MSR0_9FIRM|nr:FAD binding domain-containing protein [Natranaerovirga pectinivora]TCT16740.1 CO/xanthine dehydrogenase FAD-binding subunit [Natranaerovirga pectinivora]
MVKVYYPNTLEEAICIKDKSKSILIAGGTDIMVKKKNASGLLPKFEKSIEFIGHIKELQYITEEKNNLIIGAACTYAQIIEDPRVPEILKKAIKEIASPAIRNIGTLVGNIVNASPAGDTLPVLYNFNASINIVGKETSRDIPIMDFIVGPGRTLLKEEELVKSVEIPLKDFSYTYYKKVGARKADAISKLSFVGLANIKNKTISDIRIAFGAVGPTVIRCEEAERRLIGKKIDEDLFDVVKDIYRSSIKPIDDQRSSAKYRKTVSIRILKDFLMNCK